MAILPKMLYNNLAELMNLEGGNGKIGFRHLNLYKVFQGKIVCSFKNVHTVFAIVEV